MNLKKVDTIDNVDEARSIAIEWQKWISDQDISYLELSQYSDYFYKLAEKFPDLMEEFKENGII